MIPEGIRRPISNFIQSLKSSKDKYDADKYHQLPITNYEYLVLLLKKIIEKRPGMKLARFNGLQENVLCFVPLHDIDTYWISTA